MGTDRGGKSTLIIFNEINGMTMTEAKRFEELDIAKALSIVGMVLIHTLEYIDPDAEPEFETAYGIFADSIWGGLFAAPLFMFCMGITINFSSKSEPVIVFKRGLKLFLLSVSLNIVRDTLPNFIMGWAGLGDDCFDYGVEAIFYVDILQFAGLAFVLTGMLKYAKANDTLLIIIATVLSLVGTLMYSVRLESTVLNYILGYFVGLESCTVSYFPLCNWYLIVVIGILTGKRIINHNDFRRRFRIMAPCCWVVTIAYIALGLNGIGEFFVTEYGEYHMHTQDALLCCIAAMAVISAAGLFVEKIPATVQRLAGNMSRNITTIYIVSWLIISWAINLLLVNLIGVEFDLLTGSALAAVILAVSSFTATKISLKV